MNYDISTISSINKSYIHLNDNGTQERITTKVSDIKEIKPLLETELNHINYMFTQFEVEFNIYNTNIKNVNAIIKSVEDTIKNGIAENIPKYKRSMSNEHFELEQQRFNLNELHSNKRGVILMFNRADNKKTHYQNLLKDCEIILRG